MPLNPSAPDSNITAPQGYSRESLYAALGESPESAQAPEAVRERAQAMLEQIIRNQRTSQFSDTKLQEIITRGYAQLERMEERGTDEAELQAHRLLLGALDTLAGDFQELPPLPTPDTEGSALGLFSSKKITASNSSAIVSDSPAPPPRSECLTLASAIRNSHIHTPLLRAIWDDLVAGVKEAPGGTWVPVTTHGVTLQAGKFRPGLKTYVYLNSIESGETLRALLRKKEKTHADGAENGSAGTEPMLTERFAQEHYTPFAEACTSMSKLNGHAVLRSRLLDTLQRLTPDRKEGKFSVYNAVEFNGVTLPILRIDRSNCSPWLYVRNDAVELCRNACAPRSARLSAQEVMLQQAQKRELRGNYEAAWRAIDRFAREAGFHEGGRDLFGRMDWTNSLATLDRQKLARRCEKALDLLGSEHAETARPLFDDLQLKHAAYRDFTREQRAR